MKRNETGKNQRIPLAERLQLVRGNYFLPAAVGLRDVDFFSTVGRMTGEEEKYAQVYESYIREYGSTDKVRRDVFNLVAVAQAEQLDDETREKLLYWTLVEPFTAIKNAKQNQEGRNKL